MCVAAVVVPHALTVLYAERLMTWYSSHLQGGFRTVTEVLDHYCLTPQSCLGIGGFDGALAVADAV